MNTREIKWCATHDAEIVGGSRRTEYGPWCVKGRCTKGGVSYVTGGGVDGDPCVSHEAVVVIGEAAGPPAPTSRRRRSAVI